jgi:hypothetical protein
MLDLVSSRAIFRSRFFIKEIAAHRQREDAATAGSPGRPSAQAGNTPLTHEEWRPAKTARWLDITRTERSQRASERAGTIVYILDTFPTDDQEEKALASSPNRAFQSNFSIKCSTGQAVWPLITYQCLFSLHPLGKRGVTHVEVRRLFYQSSLLLHVIVDESSFLGIPFCI